MPLSALIDSHCFDGVIRCFFAFLFSFFFFRLSLLFFGNPLIDRDRYRRWYRQSVKEEEEKKLATRLIRIDTFVRWSFFLRCIVDACICLWDIIIGTGRFCAPTLFSFEIIDREKRKWKITYRASFIKTERNSIINKKQILKIDSSTILDRTNNFNLFFFVFGQKKEE